LGWRFRTELKPELGKARPKIGTYCGFKYPSEQRIRPSKNSPDMGFVLKEVQ
jgi:hypothetical protein